MSKIIEELQSRVNESKLRLDAATKDFQFIQAILQQAQQTFNIWNSALQAEMRDEQRKIAAATENQLPLPTSMPNLNVALETKTKQDEGLVVDVQPPKPKPVSLNPDTFIVDPTDDTTGFNKTAAVRDLLREHPAGMTAVDIWNEVKADFNHRPYLYSVLKRLRDREEIVKRRNRYFLKLIPKTQEVEDQPVVH
jgi:hypothetical protein